MEKITRREIGKLPIGSIVRVHSLDRYGSQQYLDMYILSDRHGRGYYYRDYRGLYQKHYIPSFKENDAYRYYELIKRGDENE